MPLVSAVLLFAAATTGPVDGAVSWRVPVRAAGSDWESDILVTDRDSVRQVHLIRHAPSGNLFCVSRCVGDGYAGAWTVNMSADGGQTWAETFLWWAHYPVPTVAVTCLGRFLYVLFPRYYDLSQAALVRVRGSDGGLEDFPNGGAWLMVDSLSGDSVFDCALAGSDEGLGAVLHCAVATSGRRLRVFGLDTTDFVPSLLPGRAQDVGTGLDLTDNPGFHGRPLFASYLDTAGAAVVLGFDTAGSSGVLHRGASIGGRTSLSAWFGSVALVYDDSLDRRVVRYEVSSDEGTTWSGGVLGDSVEWSSRSGCVTARQGEGYAAVYWRGMPDSAGVDYVRRDYAGSWTEPYPIQDQPADGLMLPSVEWLEPGVYGAVYIADERGGRALFDRSQPPGLAESTAPRVVAVPATLVRGVLGLPGAGRGVLADAAGRAVLRLVPGGNDLSRLASGVYFIRADGRVTGRVVVPR